MTAVEGAIGGAIIGGPVGFAIGGILGKTFGWICGKIMLEKWFYVWYSHGRSKFFVFFRMDQFPKVTNILLLFFLSG